MTMHSTPLHANDAAAAMLVRHPELRELVRVARGYLAGQVHVSHVCVTAGYFHEAAHFLPMPPDMKQMAAEWHAMAQSVSLAPETPFRTWIAAQLRQFASVDLPALQ